MPKICAKSEPPRRPPAAGQVQPLARQAAAWRDHLQAGQVHKPEGQRPAQGRAGGGLLLWCDWLTLQQGTKGGRGSGRAWGLYQAALNGSTCAPFRSWSR